MKRDPREVVGNMPDPGRIPAENTIILWNQWGIRG